MEVEFCKTPYEKMVVACLSVRERADYREISSHYARCNARKLFEFATLHEVATIVGMRLSAMEKSSPVWNDCVIDWRYRLLQRFEKLSQLGRAFADAGIPCIVLKSAAVALGVYPYPEECPMGNIDLLLNPNTMVHATDLIQKAGGMISPNARRDGTLECHFELPDDALWLKITCAPFDRRFGPIPLAPLFETSAAIEGCALKMLSPAWNLLHVCLSSAKRSYVCWPGIRMHTEVDRIVSMMPDFPWQDFLSIAKPFSGAVYFALYLPAILFGTPVPEEILAAVKPSQHRVEAGMSVIQKMGVFYPHKQLRGVARLNMAMAQSDSLLAWFRAI